MPKNPIFQSIIIGSALTLLSACSEVREEGAGQTASLEVAAAPADAAADVAAVDAAVPDLASAAPGVAFAYTYSFTLPGDAVSQVQQQHAAACGRHGVARCRITGMQFAKPRNGNPTGRLDLVIAPELAHDFGNEATELVERAEGALGNAEVTGTDAGGAIDQSFRRSADIRAEIVRIEGRLKVAGLTKDTKAELERRLQQLHEELRGESGGRAEAEKSLATTPMHFDYASQGALGSGNPFGPAATASLSSAQTALALVLMLAGYLLPWLGLALLVYLGFRFVRKALPGPSAPVEPAA